MQPSNFREHEFITLLVALMRSNRDFKDTSQEPSRTSDGEILRPDITTQYQGEELIIECKGISPLVESRIVDTIGQLRRYSTLNQRARLVLAIPNELQRKYKNLFLQENIAIWDKPQLASIFREQLSEIKGTPLHDILVGETADAVQLSPAEALIERLISTAKGKTHWSEYQKLNVDIWEYLFVPPLSKPLYENADESKINRRDIILPNYAEEGFWSFLRDKYMADFIVIDTKNYKEGVGKAEVLQVANYLKPFGSGLFGIICSRINPKSNAKLTQREQWVAYNKLIIFLNDDDLIQMLTLKKDGDRPEAVIKQRIEDFRLSL